MKKLIYCLLALLLICSCKNNEKKVSEYALTFVNAINQKDTATILKMYPDADVCASLFAKYDVNNIEVKSAVTDSCYKVVLSESAHLIVGEKEDGSFEIKDFVFPVSENDQMMLVLKKYMDVNKWQDRKNYVLDYDRIKDEMKEYYKDVQFPSKDKFDLEKMSLRGRLDGHDNIYSVEYDGMIYYMEKTEEGFKIDWEPSVGYNKESFTAMYNEGLSRVCIFMRLGISIVQNLPDDAIQYELFDDYNNSVALGESSYNIYGGKIANRLYHLLKDGKKHQIYCYLLYDPQDYYGTPADIYNFKEGWYDKPAEVTYDD